MVDKRDLDCSSKEVGAAIGFVHGDNDKESMLHGESAKKIQEEGASSVDTDRSEQVNNQNDGGTKSVANHVAEADSLAPDPDPNERKLRSLSSSMEHVDLDFSLGSLESPRPLNKRQGISLDHTSSAPSSSASAKKRKISSILPIKSLAEALQPEFWQDSAAVSEHNIASASFDVAEESGGSSPFSVENDGGSHVDEEGEEVDQSFIRKLSDEDKIRIMEAEEVMRVASLAAEAESPPVAVGSSTDMCNSTKESEILERHVQNGVQHTDSDNLDNFSSSASLLEESNMTMTDEEFSRPLPPAPPSTPAMSARDIFAPLPYQSQCDVGGGKISFSDEIRRDELNGTFKDPFDADAITPPPENTVPEQFQPGKGNAPFAKPPISDMSGSVTEPRRGGGTVAKQRLIQSTRSEFEKWNVGDRYQLKRLLGRGSYGEVAQAIDLNAANSLAKTDDLQITSNHTRSAYVAVKRIRNAFDQETDAIRLFRELHILRRLRGHACVIQLYDVVQPSCDLQHFNNLYLVFEYVDTDLYKLIMSPQYLTTEHIQTFLYQMLVGVKYIHSSSVIHRDLKPAILVNEDCTLKICDFGLARIVQNDKASPLTAPQLRNDNFGADIDVGPRESTSETAEEMLDEDSQLTSSSRPHLSRQLTKHVVTRWYRAPELILIQPYGAAVDIWSIGCIFGELLSMQEGSVQNYQNRVPLFPGGSCYPLSRDHVSSNTNERLDQLNVIFSVIGVPSEEDLKSVGKANEYVSSLQKRPGRSLESLYPAANPTAIDLLKKMLMFNPLKRCTAEDALEHEFLKPVRRKEMEICVTQPLESPKFLETSHIDVTKLKEETYKEVLWYK